MLLFDANVSPCAISFPHNSQTLAALKRQQQQHRGSSDRCLSGTFCGACRHSHAIAAFVPDKARSHSKCSLRVSTVPFWKPHKEAPAQSRRWSPTTTRSAASPGPFRLSCTPGAHTVPRPSQSPAHPENPEQGKSRRLLRQLSQSVNSVSQPASHPALPCVALRRQRRLGGRQLGGRRQRLRDSRKTPPQFEQASSTRPLPASNNVRENGEE
ncbi:hypothetical protein BKA81DRAFT_170869 [Phyllosticta paracitricarpa]|uniref:Uncharacterized protein n=2 Tax=Phyllosticta TaxID=121621 RepID=A0ABR1MJ17_9PEZI